MPENSKKIFYYSAVTAVFIVYIFTLAPSVIQIDSGELAAVQKTLGIAHPTGYPLFTLTGYLFLKLPLPFSDIFKANLLAAIWCSIGLFLFIKSANILLINKDSVQAVKKTKSKQTVPIVEANNFISIFLPSLLGGLLLAFSKTYWFQSTSVEVYSLQIFLFNLIIFTVLSAYFSKDTSIKPWIPVSISLALGFSNHMTTILVLPLIAVLFFKKEKFNSAALIKVAIMLSLFFPLLILFYSYLQIRASTNPSINWGNAINFENFWRHFTGKQYQVWLFDSFASAKKQFSYYIQNLPAEFAYIGLFVPAIGTFILYKHSKIIFYSLFITFIFSVLYSINYDIVDIDSYFLLSYIMLGLLAVFGFSKTIGSLNKSGKFIITFVAIPVLFEIGFNFGKVNQSGQHTFEDYTLAILNNADSNSVIFTYQWDYFVSSSYYYQYAEGIRKDVAVIDKELLRRSWYYNQMKRNYPVVIKNVFGEINSFLEVLEPFERGGRFDAALLEKYYRAIMTKLILENADKNSFYVGSELFQSEMQKGEFTIPAGYQIVPDLLMFKVVKGNHYVPAKNPDFKIRFNENKNVYTENIKKFVGMILTYRAKYELIYNKTDRAKIYINKIKTDLPDFAIPDDILKKIK